MHGKECRTGEKYRKRRKKKKRKEGEVGKKQPQLSLYFMPSF
jgi:hypothetical protein